MSTSDTLFFGNLDARVTRRTLYDLCCQAGPVAQVRLPQDQQGNQRGFGFCQYTDSASAAYAIALFKGSVTLYGRSVAVDYSSGSSGNSSAAPTGARPVAQQDHALGQPQWQQQQVPTLQAHSSYPPLPNENDLSFHSSRAPAVTDFMPDAMLIGRSSGSGLDAFRHPSGLHSQHSHPPPLPFQSSIKSIGPGQDEFSVWSM